MFEEGLVEEVRGLMSAPRPMGSVTAQGVGYREVIGFLHGRHAIAETINLVQTRTRQFAKRQGTWFRGLEEVMPVPMGDAGVEELAESLARKIESTSQN